MVKTIIITGTPGCGKTSLGNSLAKRLDASIIHLTDLIKNSDYPKEYDKARDTWIINEKKMKRTVKKQIQAARQANVNYLIIESHFSDIVPNKYIDLAIVLRCDPEILYNRLISRGYVEEKAKENVQSEILGGCVNYLLQKRLSVPIYEFDTSNVQIQDLSEQIIKIIKGQKVVESFLLGKIDWLEKISENEDLTRKLFYDEN